MTEFPKNTYASDQLQIITYFAKSTDNNEYFVNSDRVVCTDPLFIYIHMTISVADMWQKVAGIFTSGGKHQIWYVRVLGYAESKK